MKICIGGLYRLSSCKPTLELSDGAINIFFSKKVNNQWQLPSIPSPLHRDFPGPAVFKHLKKTGPEILQDDRLINLKECLILVFFRWTYSDGFLCIKLFKITLIRFLRMYFFVGTACTYKKILHDLKRGWKETK